MPIARSKVPLTGFFVTSHPHAARPVLSRKARPLLIGIAALSYALASPAADTATPKTGTKYKADRDMQVVLDALAACSALEEASADRLDDLIAAYAPTGEVGSP